MTSKVVKLIGDKVILRPEPDGKFDELLLMEGADCRVHAEMMDNGCLWIGIYPRGEKKRRAVMWITAKGHKLEVNAHED